MENSLLNFDEKIATTEKVEKYLPLEDFKDYCDAIYTAVAYQDVILKAIKSPDKEDDTSNSINRAE